jgi:hypothetical protein
MHSLSDVLLLMYFVGVSFRVAEAAVFCLWYAGWAPPLPGVLRHTGGGYKGCTAIVR